MFLPPLCILCRHPIGKTPYHLCSPCLQDLPILPQHCQQCAQFLLSTENKPIWCGSCLSNKPPFDLTHALFPYAPPIIKLITQLKFNCELSHAKAFGELLVHVIKTTWYAKKPLPDLIIPVPLHRKRLRERGFNQTLEIAKPVAKGLSIPIDLKGIERIRYTLAQSHLPAIERKQNVANAFAVHRDYRSLSIAVIDDVITTGYTISACCQALKDSGAKSIDVWCVARRG